MFFKSIPSENEELHAANDGSVLWSLALVSHTLIKVMVKPERHQPRLQWRIPLPTEEQGLGTEYWDGLFLGMCLEIGHH